MAREAAVLTVHAVDRLLRTEFPEGRFGELHHWSRVGKKAPPTADAHRKDALGKQTAMGENVATRRRIDRAAELLEDDPEADLDEVIGQAWADEPLAGPANGRPRPPGESGNGRPKPARESGLYVVVPRSRTKVPVDITPSRIGQVAKVDCSNVKFGVSVDLARRQRDYEHTFAIAGVDFEVVCRLQPEDLPAAESCIKAKLRGKRMRSPRGRLLEWLEDVGKAEVIQAARECCRRKVEGERD